MTVRELLALGKDRLQAAGVPDPELDAEYLLSSVLNLPRLEMRLSPAKAIGREDESRFLSLLSFRAERVPLQYLLGNSDFYGLSLRVDERVLIPRPETELLCELALRHLQAWDAPKVLDLCTGSGAIALAICSHLPAAEVYACDVSRGALSVAEENARLLGLNIHFAQSDLMEAYQGKRFHAILSNPPYIPTEECKKLQPEVLREPLLALDGGRDGLAFYRAIARQAAAHLEPGGLLMMECGSEQTGEIETILFRNHFQDISVYQDLEQHPRIISGRFRE